MQDVLLRRRGRGAVTVDLPVEGGHGEGSESDSGGRGTAGSGSCQRHRGRGGRTPRGGECVTVSSLLDARITAQGAYRAASWTASPTFRGWRGRQPPSHSETDVIVCDMDDLITSSAINWRGRAAPLPAFLAPSWSRETSLTALFPRPGPHLPSGLPRLRATLPPALDPCW